MSANQTMTGELPSEPVAARRLKTTRVPDDAHAHVYDGWNRRLAGYVDATVLPHADDDSQTGDRGKSGSGLEQRPAGVVRDVGGVAVHAGGAGGSGGLQSWGAWMAAQHAANLRFLRGLGGGSFRASGGVGTLATAGAAALSGARSSLSAGWSSAAGLAGLFGNAVFSVIRGPLSSEGRRFAEISNTSAYRAAGRGFGLLGLDIVPDPARTAQVMRFVYLARVKSPVFQVKLWIHNKLARIAGYREVTADELLFQLENNATFLQGGAGNVNNLYLRYGDAGEEIARRYFGGKQFVFGGVDTNTYLARITADHELLHLGQWMRNAGARSFAHEVIPAFVGSPSIFVPPTVGALYLGWRFAVVGGATARAWKNALE